MLKRTLQKQYQALLDKLSEADREITDLHEQLTQCADDVCVLQRELSASEAKNIELSNKIKLLREQLKTSEKIVVSEPVAVNRTSSVSESPANADGLSDHEYGIHMISKIILETTKLNCSLAENNSDIKKELIHLALGRCEISKENISNILLAPPDEHVREKVLREYNETMDYLKTVTAQLT